MKPVVFNVTGIFSWTIQFFKIFQVKYEDKIFFDLFPIKCMSFNKAGNIESYDEIFIPVTLNPHKILYIFYHLLIKNEIIFLLPD